VKKKYIDNLKALRNSTFVTNVVKLAGGSAIGQALVMLSTPLITRLYDPADMGVFGLFMSFIAFASVGVALRYDLAIVAARDKFEADVLLITSIALAVPCVLIASVVLSGMIHFSLLGFAALPGWSALAMFVALLATGVFSSLRFWYVGRRKFGEISLALVSQGAGRAIIPVILGWLSSGWTGLLGGEILGRMLGVVRLVRGAWPEVRTTFAALDVKQGTQVLRRYWKYPAVFLPSSMIDALATSLPLPIISSLFGVSAAGQYFLVYRLASVPAALISAGVADVFHAKIAEAARNDKSSVHRIMKAAMQKLTVVSMGIYLPTAFASPFLFALVFGESWQQAGILMAIQSLACMTGLVVSPLSRALAISKNPELKLLPDIVRLIVPVSGIWICYHFGMTFLLTMVVFSLLSAIAEIFYMFIIWYATAEQRHLPLH
jgi:O-antigen/teichoic acid export membrane protein